MFLRMFSKVRSWGRYLHLREGKYRALETPTQLEGSPNIYLSDLITKNEVGGTCSTHGRETRKECNNLVVKTQGKYHRTLSKNTMFELRMSLGHYSLSLPKQAGPILIQFICPKQTSKSGGSLHEIKGLTW